MNKFRPLADQILLKRIDEEKETSGGIIIPDTAKEKPVEAVVVAVGNGKRLDSGEICKIELKKGDRVLFGKYAGAEITLDGEEHVILREDEILGVIG